MLAVEHRYRHSACGCFIYPCGYLEYLTMEERYKLYKELIGRVSAPRSATNGVLAAGDSEFMKDYPVLGALMLFLGEGKERRSSTASLTVFCEDGMWKVVVGDRAEHRKLWASGTTFVDAIAALEERLNAPVVEWRYESTRGQGGPRK